MSVYRNMIEAVELAIFQHQYKTTKEIAWFVEWWTGMRNVNPREVEKMVHKVATDYKA
jgi:hypothetical protein